MNTTRTIATVAALTSLFALTQSQAADEVALLNMKPMQALSLDAGSEHIVSFYLSDNGQCRLYVTRAAEQSESNSFTATRYEARIDAGKSTRFVSASVSAYEFACSGDALAMNVMPVQQVAAAGSR